MREIGVGVIGAGYMGKRHSVAMAAVGAVFETGPRPRLAAIATRSEESAERAAAAFGFERGAGDWRAVVDDEAVEAVVIASPQHTHREIVEAAAALGKPILCEKPLGASLDDALAMERAVRRAGVVNMVGFNYRRTPATQWAMARVRDGRLGEITYFAGEHAEDFCADPRTRAEWRNFGEANGALGDLAPHMIDCALGFVGPIESLTADLAAVHRMRPGAVHRQDELNDDQCQILCRFETGAMGRLFFSRIATGRKMGYAYEIHGTKGAIRFDQEDQNALFLYRAEGPEAERGFVRILAGPAHPDYRAFCEGPGHGTGYQDQIVIEARDFLSAIERGRSPETDFAHGLEVAKICAAARASAASGAWRRPAETT